MPVSFRKEKDIGFIEFDLPDNKVNLLTSQVIIRLKVLLKDVAAQDGMKALVFTSAKPNVFIAGADIKEIEQITDPDDGTKKAQAGQELMNQIEDLAVPTIALIDGVALGGGCELALACDYRLATHNPKVRIGLPEVNLGFVPGFGGTYRLPRIVRMSQAMTMILTGRPIDGARALKIGLVDRLLTQKGLERELQTFVDEITTKPWPHKYVRNIKSGMKGFPDEFLLGQWLIMRQARQNVEKQTKGFYPAPLRAIVVVKENFFCNRERGLLIEAGAFGSLAVTSISKNLVHVFYLSEQFKKISVPGAEAVKSRPIGKCAVIGAGVMGGGIAQLFAAKDVWVRLKDLNDEALGKGMKAAYDLFTGLARKRKISPSEAQRKMAMITPTLDFSGIGSCDLIIEAVVENMEVKKKVFAELEAHAAAHAILATNTSALSVTEMATALKDPSRLVGFHFFNPVHRMPLVEVIRTPEATPEVLQTALDLARRLGKTPILVKDSCGFIVNRILLIYINEAGRILEETRDMTGIDEAMTSFGMPMGPFTLSDEVGLDVGIKVLQILAEAFGERFAPVPVFEKVYKEGLLGKKSGKGFYIHDGSRAANSRIDHFLPRQDTRPLDREACRQRLLYLMINEAARCLEEKVVEDAASIDVGMIFGTGFPPFHGGLLKYADATGLNHIVQRLEAFQQRYQSDRFEACTLLKELASAGSGFYSFGRQA